MAVRKPCRSKGCKASPRCEHPWWLDVMHNHRRYRMPVDDFALARGATAPVTSKQEAEKVWEPKFIAEIVSGKDPRVPIERETKFERPTTVADLLKLYRSRYVEVEPLKSRAGMLSQLNVLSAQLGTLPATFSSLVIFLEAIAAATFGWLLLNESLGRIQAFGGVLILIDIFVARPRASEVAGL